MTVCCRSHGRCDLAWPTLNVAWIYSGSRVPSACGGAVLEAVPHRPVSGDRDDLLPMLLASTAAALVVMGTPALSTRDGAIPTLEGACSTPLGM